MTIALAGIFMYRYRDTVCGPMNLVPNRKSRLHLDAKYLKIISLLFFIHKSIFAYRRLNKHEVIAINDFFTIRKSSLL